jgi:hypothetical protein
VALIGVLVVTDGTPASFALSWKGSGAAADRDTPQSLTVSLPGAGESEVPLSEGPAPFDVVDGATVLVGPWQRDTP